MKTVSYDDDDDDDYDDDYDSPDPEEQEFLEQCTTDVLNELRGSAVTASREEVQEALWHYYNDVEKSVNYLRSECGRPYAMFGETKDGVGFGGVRRAAVPC